MEKSHVDTHSVKAGQKDGLSEMTRRKGRGRSIISSYVTPAMAAGDILPRSDSGLDIPDDRRGN